MRHYILLILENRAVLQSYEKETQPSAGTGKVPAEGTNQSRFRETRMASPNSLHTAIKAVCPGRRISASYTL